MKNGFTLIEILLVVALVAIISVSSIIIFERSSSSTNEEKLIKTYVDIQRAAIIYMDLNSTWLESFREEKSLTVKIGLLQNENYIDLNIKNPVTKTNIPSDYLVKVYVAGNNEEEYLNSCIIKYNADDAVCIANNSGKPCGCCNFPTSSNNVSCN
jgi:prepilin-type N-terminal cleavage/methylation domain-containing protein